MAAGAEVVSGFVYLASPYSHPDAAVRERRFVEVSKVASALMAAGDAVFCPIAHSHPIDTIAPLPQTTEFWMAQDLPILRCASRVVVLMLDGWQNSKGVAREIQAAEAVGIPVEFMAHEPAAARAPEDIIDDE